MLACAQECKAQVKQRFRLTRSTDFKRVRHSGKSYAHPLLVLYAVTSEEPGMHVGVSAGLAVGNAVKRNRAKRLLRAAMQDLLPYMLPGSDLLLIARPLLSQSNLCQTRIALTDLLKRAGLLPVNYDG
jgi:ribonuclease P protein component